MPGLPSFKDFLQGLKDDLKGTIMYIAFGVIIVLFGIVQAANKKRPTTERQSIFFAQ